MKLLLRFCWECCSLCFKHLLEKLPTCLRTKKHWASLLSLACSYLKDTDRVSLWAQNQLVALAHPAPGTSRCILWILLWIRNSFPTSVFSAFKYSHYLSFEIVKVYSTLRKSAMDSEQPLSCPHGEWQACHIDAGQESCWFRSRKEFESLFSPKRKSTVKSQASTTCQTTLSMEG